MRFLYFLVILLAFSLFSCGDDASENADKNCPSQCQENASCNTSTKVCECNTGFKADGEACIKELSEICKDVTCKANSTCSDEDGKCKCDTGFVLEGEDCVKESLCKAVTCDENSTCSEETGKCECNDGYYYSELLFACTEDEKCKDINCEAGYSCLSGHCYLDNECSTENPNGVCPSINNQVILVCSNGLCITENEGNLEESATCNPNTNDCIAGTVCVDAFENGLHKCRAFCDLTTNNSCGEEGVCAPYLDEYSRNTGICLKSDPECDNNQDNCPENFKCAEMINAKVCKAEGDGEHGDDCDNNVANDELKACKDGLFCVGDEDEMTCQELCDPENQTDLCQEGRCIALQDIEATASNNDIGLCLDIPNFCSMEAGIKENPMCPENSLCFGAADSNRGICFMDECEPNNDQCGENTSCTRGFMSTYQCIADGNLEYNETGCVNPQDEDTDEEDLVSDKLCKKGLVCLANQTGSTCMELCDPTIENACVNDESATCFDINNFSRDFPAGINGVCTALPTP